MSSLLLYQPSAYLISAPAPPLSSLSMRSRRGPQRHSRMTTHCESSPQASWWCVIVVPVELVDPSVVRTTWTTLPAVLGRMAESQINMTSECLVCLRIFGKPGNVIEDRFRRRFMRSDTGPRPVRAATSEFLMWSCQQILDIWPRPAHGYVDDLWKWYTPLPTSLPSELRRCQAKEYKQKVPWHFDCK